MYLSFATLVALFGSISCHYYPSAWSIPATPVPRCELGNQFRYLPMYVVPERQLSVVQDYRTRYFTPAPALVNFIGHKEALPAVRVVLNNPIPVSTWKTFVEFPTSFTILQDGLRLPFPVSALYAPLPEHQLLRRPLIDVVYAVPAAPTLNVPSTVTPLPVATSTALPPVEPAPLPAQPPRNVTVLHFPEALAEPQVIYQEEDDELGGRNPPLPVIPAGIVQSAAPTPDVTVFVNSKESPVLQLLRDQATRSKAYVRTYGNIFTN